MTSEAPTRTYRPLDARTVLDYARPDLAAPPTRAAEIGDGNLNLVFRVVAADGASVIVKQALPYARVVGPGWPLTLERAGIEARALAIQGDLCPGLVPALHRYDPAMAALVMEDLAGHLVLRRGLIAGRVYPRAPEALGRFCARMALGTSDLLLGPPAKQAQAARFANPELCAITERLVFTDPFRDAPGNAIEPALLPDARRLWRDAALRRAADRLRFRFCTRGEALVHGDLHTGSVMVTAEDTKVIDAEFACYGPMGLDLGMLLANLAMARLAHAACGHAAYATWLDAAAGTVWATFVAEVADLWPAGERWRRAFLGDLLPDVAAYAGAEMIRRTLGLAHVADTDGIAEEAPRLAAKRAVLTGGRALLLGAGRVRQFATLWCTALGAAGAGGAAAHGSPAG